MAPDDAWSHYLLGYLLDDLGKLTAEIEDVTELNLE
ncbi:MAG: hypothetical protein ACMUHY_08230 [Thermoplasmatota archaeon]